MKRPARIEEVLGVACMVVLVLLTLGNVLTRYLTDASFAWTEEISIFLIVVMTLAGAASIAARDGHIRIEFLYDSGSRAPAARAAPGQRHSRPPRCSPCWPLCSASRSPTRSSGPRPRWASACRAGGSRRRFRCFAPAIAVRAAAPAGGSGASAAQRRRLNRRGADA